MNRIAAAIVTGAVAIVASGLAMGQSAPSNPAITYGMKPTVGQWNNWFQQKQDALNFFPVNRAGDVMLGKLSLLAASSSATGFNIGIGATPIAPNDGDMWATSVGLYLRINGVTVGPYAPGLASGTSGGIPYFNTSTSQASSAALSHFGVIYGGGAGGSPVSTAAGAADTALMGAGSVTPPAFAALTNCASAVTYSTGSHAWGCNASAANGPASSTDTAIARYSGTGGKTLQDSQITADGSGHIGGISSLAGVGAGGVAVQGTTTNGSASSGYVGEYITASLASGSAVSLVSTTTVATVSLGAGDWDVRGTCSILPNSASITSVICAVNSSAAFPSLPSDGYTLLDVSTSVRTQTFGMSSKRLSLSATTTVYLLAGGAYTGSPTVYGIISARRVR